MTTDTVIMLCTMCLVTNAFMYARVVYLEREIQAAYERHLETLRAWRKSIEDSEDRAVQAWSHLTRECLGGRKWTQ